MASAVVNGLIYSDCDIEVNGTPLTSIVPNSVTFNIGLAEQVVVVNGGNAGESVLSFGEKIETRVAKVEFEIYGRHVSPDESPSQFAQRLKSNDRNTLVVTINGNGLILYFDSVRLTNSPDVAISADSKVKLEFHGVQTREVRT